MLQALSKHKSNALFVYDHWDVWVGPVNQSWAALFGQDKLANVERRSSDLRRVSKVHGG